MKKQERPKPRLNPNDGRYVTRVVPDKKKKGSKDSCRKYKGE